jgi:hypothetical protein
MANSPFTGRLRIGDMVLPEGAEVGLIGGLAVVFLARDLAAGHWLHTPSVLGTLLFYRPVAAREGSDGKKRAISSSGSLMASARESPSRRTPTHASCSRVAQC